MTVPSETNRSGPYSGNGSTTVFGYGFRIVNENHLKVIKTAGGVDTVLTVDVDYEVADVGEAGGGQIALVTPPAVGETITILRNVPFTQETDLENQGAYYAETVEDALDVAAMRDQQLSEELSRAFRIPASVDGVDPELPAPEADKFLAWDSDAQRIRNIDRSELVSIVSYGTAEADIFTGDGIETDFSLSFNPASVNNLDVSIGGAAQMPGDDYEWLGGLTVRFVSPPPDGVKILIRYMRALPQGYIDGRNIIGGVRSVTVEYNFNADFFHVGDDFIRAANLATNIDTAVGSGKIRAAYAINNVVLSNRANGPAQASVGLTVRSIKPDFLTSVSTQEADGFYGETKTGKLGDTSVYLGDAVGVDGGISFVNLLEGTASLVSDTTGAQTKVIRTQLAAFDQASGGSFGFNAVAEKGVIGTGILLQGLSSGNYFANFLTATKDGVIQWQVDGTGNVYAAGSVNVPRINNLIGAAAFLASPNYAGSYGDSATVSISGSAASPDATQGAAGYFQKTSSATSFNSLAGVARKTVSTANSRATAVYGEAYDPVGGTTSFVEGGRFQGVLTGGANGSAYGAICAAGTNASGPTTPAYLIGCEGEVTKQVGADAPIFGSFNANSFTASFVATAGVGVASVKKVDAAFVVNPYSVGKFRTGLLLSSAVDDTGIAALAGTRLASGIDLHLATLSYSVMWAPNNVPVRWSNAAGTAGLNALNVNAANKTVVSQETLGTIIAGLSAKNYASDAAAAAAGIAIDELYHNNGAVRVRIT